MKETLLNRIASRKAAVSVVGLGYVGLPLAVEFARSGFTVTGIDVNRDKVERINRGANYIGDVSSETLHALVSEGRLRASVEFEALRDSDAVSICVPTPLRKSKDPDISFIVSAVEQVARHAPRPVLIVLESTTYPGTTREVVLPLLEAAGLREGQDLFLAFSPERVDPGNPEYKTRNIPKIMGGLSPVSTEVAAALYESVVERVVQVSSAEVAEIIKLLENTFRSVNIALVNEIALICSRLGIDVWEVIDGAATKPFGYHPFYPGPGIGGHCLPVDPHYLSWKAKLVDFEPRFIDLASAVNSRMPHHVVDLIADALNDRRKSVNGAGILLLGVAYKRDVDDVRESPALEVVKLLLGKHANVRFHDPCVDRLRFEDQELRSQPLSEELLREADCAVILTDHTAFDYEQIVRLAPLVVDTRNATRFIRVNRDRIVKL